MTVAQCSVGSDLQEKMFALIVKRVLADDPTKGAEERLAAPDAFAAMKEFTKHRTSCQICKRQSADEFCAAGKLPTHEIRNVGARCTQEDRNTIRRFDGAIIH